jgi:hypothetical protein
LKAKKNFKFHKARKNSKSILKKRRKKSLKIQHPQAVLPQLLGLPTPE